jgi:hypothetical protein
MPEQRPDKRGVVVTRWVKPNVHGSSQKPFAPAPTTGTPPERTEQSRSLFEKVIDSLVNFLLGPEENASAEDHAARDLLRQRLAELPERTVRNLSDAWEKAKQWADDGLDSTDFGKFSERVREQVATLLEDEQMREQSPERTAERVDDYADRVRRTTEARTQPRREEPVAEPVTEPERHEYEPPEEQIIQGTVIPIPEAPAYEPSVHNWQAFNEHQEAHEGTFSPLDDFFQEVDNGANREYNSSIDDLMDNGRTRRHH